MAASSTMKSKSRGRGRAVAGREPKPPPDWLLSGPAFVRYRTLLDLMDKPKSHPDVKAAYAEMLADPLVDKLIADVNAWECQRAITRHNDAAHPLHKLVFLADIGLTRKQLAPAVNAIVAHQSKDGPFQVRIEIPKAFGGDGVAKWDWVATDAPLVLYSLLRLGVHNKKVFRGVEHIRSRIGEPAFSCFASSTMGRFKGPGRKGDPCPYANLIILRMLAEIPELRAGPEATKAAAMLLRHWQQRGQQKHFLFGIGTDFKKPKAPLIWYDIMHYVDTLSRFPQARQDKRLREAVDQLESQADSSGRLTSASVWLKWKGWEFCQKKAPSYWLTFLLHRALKRLVA